MSRTVSLRRATALGVLCMTLAAVCNAQLSGSYTINPNGTGNRNFPTFDAATKQLFIQGQSGPVTMTVSPGTYNESWLILPSGSSATQPLTFRSVFPGLVKLQASDAITLFFPALTAKYQVSHVTLENLDYISTTAATHAILFGKGNTNHLIKNCTFGQGLRGISSRGLIDVESSGSADIEIAGCKFDTSPTSSSGYIIYTQGTPGMNIHHNEFIFNGGFSYGVSLWNSNAGRSRIYNNLFRGTMQNSASARCLRLNVSGYQIDIINNTFDVTLLNASAWVVDSSGLASNRHNRFINNIVNVRGLGGGYRHSGTATNAVPIEIDYNLYNVASGNIGYVNATAYTTLSGWSAALAVMALNNRNEQNSLTGDPMFVGATDWHAKAGSPVIGKGIAAHASFSGLQVVDDLDGLLRGSPFDIGCYELSGFELYGSGCPGTGNNVPALNFTGELAPAAAFSLTVQNGLASANALVSIGLTRTNLPLGGSCSLLNSAEIILGLQLDATGKASIPFQVPANAPVLGTRIHAQWGVVDGGAAGLGLAMSNGGSMRL